MCLFVLGICHVYTRANNKYVCNNNYTCVVFDCMSICVPNRFATGDYKRMQGIPCSYALIKGKSEAKYDPIFKKMASLIGNKTFNELSSDLEPGLYNGAIKYFKAVRIILCNWHKIQGTQRKINELGFKKYYQRGKDLDIHFRELVLLTESIAYIPRKFKKYSIELTRNKHCSNNIQNEYKYYKLYDYYDSNTLLENARFHWKLWDVSGKRLNTNNVTEGVNYRLNTKLAGNLSLVRWTTEFNKLETQFKLEYNEMKQNGIKRRNIKSIENEMNRNEIINQMNELTFEQSNFDAKFDSLWQQLVLTLSKGSKNWDVMKQHHTKQFLGQ